MTKNQCQQFSSSFQESTTISIFLVILVLFANVYVLLFPDLIFKPLVIALVVSFVLKCSINLMRRVKNPRIIAVVIRDDSCKLDFIRHRNAETNLYFDG
jgi:predicted PurR-regulated permease PerM